MSDRGPRFGRRMLYPATYGLLLQALGARAALPVLLRILPLDRLLQALTPRSASPSRDREPGDMLAAIEHVTDVVTRSLRPTRSACLQRALMRYAMLRRQGYAAGFVMGVRPGGPDGFEAHAWVTLDDQPILEAHSLNYRPTFVWPQPS